VSAASEAMTASSVGPARAATEKHVQIRTDRAQIWACVIEGSRSLHFVAGDTEVVFDRGNGFFPKVLRRPSSTSVKK
jgi:hypothetical protein